MSSSKPTFSDPRLNQFLESAPVEVKEPTNAPQKDAGLNAFEILARMPEEEGTKPLNLRIPVSLHRQLKVMANMAGVTMSSIILDALRADVKRRIDRFNRGE